MITLSHHKSGFSLVETLVAITILLIVITGPMSIVANATQGTDTSSDRVIAYFLAQEGAELVQKVRDDLLLPRFDGAAGNAWNEFTTGVTYEDCFSGGCGLEIETDVEGSVTVVDCRTSAVALTNCQLHIQPSGERSRYTYDEAGTEPTVFRRVISLSRVTANDIQVTSRVTWRPSGQQREQEAEVVTYLYDVYGR